MKKHLTASLLEKKMEVIKYGRISSMLALLGTRGFMTHPSLNIACRLLLLGLVTLVLSELDILVIYNH